MLLCALGLAFLYEEVQPTVIIEKEIKFVGSKGEHELVGLFDNGVTYYEVGASGTSRFTAYPRMTSHEALRGQAKRVYPWRRF